MERKNVVNVSFTFTRISYFYETEFILLISNNLHRFMYTVFPQQINDSELCKKYK